MSHLQQLLANKYREVKEKKEVIEERVFRMSPSYKKRRKSLKKHLTSWEGEVIFPVFMRQTPEVDALNGELKPHALAKALERAGAAGIAVATDQVFYGATVEDMRSVRKNCKVPVIRFDMIIDPFQVTESKAMGADAIILEAGIESEQATFEQLMEKAREEKMQVIAALNREKDARNIPDDVEFVLIHRRDPETRAVKSEKDLEVLLNAVPKGKMMFVAGGVQGKEDIEKLKSLGFQGFFVGENLMKDAAPAFILESLLNE